MKYLVLGGANSGKSIFAEKLALDLHSQKLKSFSDAQLFYLATCPNSPSDAEMSARILAHKARRNNIWKNIEESINIAQFLTKLDDSSTVLIDCLTLWLSNLMYKNTNIHQEFENLCGVLSNIQANVILVSNEVGMGLVPETKLGRDFRNLQGKLNQIIAQKTDKVTLVVAGCPLHIKN